MQFFSNNTEVDQTIRFYVYFVFCNMVFDNQYSLNQ